MRHFIIRLIIGIVWLILAVFRAAELNLLLAALYAVIGVVFLFSAYKIRKKQKRDRE